jgi:phosphate transport system substrate-binding protein
MKLIKYTVASAALMVVSAAALGADHITMIGSDTMVKLGQRWAEAYMQSHPETVIQVTGGGSSSGIAALLNGSTNICQASREMSADEQRSAESRGIKPFRLTVALDGIAVYLNEENPIRNLSLLQLKNIYTGVVTDWSQVGGPQHRIILYSRENSSGTYTYFKAHVLDGEDFAPETEDLAGTSAVIHAVLNDPYGIGFGGFAYHEGVACAALELNDSTEAITPTAETVSNETYPLARGLYWYLSGAPSGKLKELVDWVLSDEGQMIAEQNGYVAVAEPAAGSTIVK